MPLEKIFPVCACVVNICRSTFLYSEYACSYSKFLLSAENFLESENFPRNGKFSADRMRSKIFSLEKIVLRMRSAENFPLRGKFSEVYMHLYMAFYLTLTLFKGVIVNHKQSHIPNFRKFSTERKIFRGPHAHYDFFSLISAISTIFKKRLSMSTLSIMLTWSSMLTSESMSPSISTYKFTSNSKDWFSLTLGRFKPCDSFKPYASVNHKNQLNVFHNRRKA